MGNTCCHELDQKGNHFEVSDVPRINEYFQSSPPNDSFLQQQLQLSTLLQAKVKQAPLKHKIYDRWFWGNWQNGQPKGNGIVYIKDPQGTILYEGQFNGQPEGKGKLIFNEGQSQYEGQIKNSKANGFGILKNEKQNYLFEGEWKDSKPKQGILKINPNENPSEEIIIELRQNQRKNKIIYPDGRIYEGQIDKKNYVPHGLGKVIFKNKSSYDGDWEEGKMHGKGTFKWLDGSQYHGDYFYGKKHGSGRFTFSSGNYYEGYWAEGRQNGRGLLYDKHSNELRNGYWRDGIFQANKTLQ